MHWKIAISANYFSRPCAVAASYVLVVAIDGEKMEKLWVEHLVLLGENEDDAPKVGDKPGIDALVAAVCSYEDVRNLGKQSFERELIKIGSKGILINVDDLVRHRGIHFNLLISVAHCFAVRVLDAAFNVAKHKSLAPFDEPLPRRIARFHYSQIICHYLLLLHSRFLLLLCRHLILLCLNCLFRLILLRCLIVLLIFVILWFPIIVRAATFI